MDDAITHDGAEGLVGVQFADERPATFALCPLLGLGFRGTNGSTLLGSSDIQTRSTIVGLALGAAPLLSNPGLRLLPSIELQVRFDRSEGTSTFSGTTTTTNSKAQYLVTTVGLGVAFGRLTFTPLYQRRFDERLISKGFRASFNFGPPIR